MRTDDLATHLPEHVRIVRVMPNTPCVVGEMAAGYCFGSRSETGDDAIVGSLMSACGNAQHIEERLMDAVTGLSGAHTTKKEG